MEKITTDERTKIMATNNDEYLDKLEPKSQTIFQDFMQTYSPKSWFQLRTAICTIIVETNIYDFSELTYSDYAIFFSNASKKTTGNKYSIIKQFFKYLYCKNIIKNELGFEKCFWDKDKLCDYFEKRIDLINNPKNSKDKYVPALTADQLERLMIFEKECSNSDEKNYKNQRLTFCFYLLFFEEIQISTIRGSIDAKNFSDGKISCDEGILDIPEKYWDMLNYYKQRPHSGFSLLDEYIRQLGKIVGIKDLIPNSISQKRKQNTFICPECGKNVLSFSANWKSINGILMCNNCSERVYLSVKKKIIEIESLNVDFLAENLLEKIHFSNTSYRTMKKDLKFPTDYLELHKFLIKIGELGEKYVYEHEINRLLEINSELADLVDLTPADNSANGFDILSYTETGEKIYIEVKTTTDTSNTPFYMSKHELTTAKEFWKHGYNYQIHRIYDILNNDESKIGYIIYDSLEKLNLIETSYKLESK